MKIAIPIFFELQENEQEYLDYRIIVHHRNPDIAVLAIHGGNIEPGTSEVAAALGETLCKHLPIRRLKAKGQPGPPYNIPLVQ
ncbi:poly-gamma-glutamate hydrolase family protein [Peribacillus frigoritolerans]|nr:poly-gamma-glutamate hydrolase family protein [Peribacillus frigoritolerans]